ncbi:MAG: S8 family serine peptidase [Kocuria sp.]|uniref:S8 family serine peptidase n=1 Tax=Kocuria TaxID=57493 RepID=UPI0011A1D5CF|nr:MULTISPECIES: S8 family serine peptidase [Kocuria]MDO4257829.1 S8 family serine peptidase [Kocuria sp.]
MGNARVRGWIAAGLSAAVIATAGPAAAAPPGGATSSGEQAAQVQPAVGGGVSSLGRGPAGQGRVLPETDRFVVEYKQDVPQERRSAALAQAAQASDLPRAKTVRTTGSGEDVVETDTMLSPAEQKDMVAAIEANPAVESAEPDQIVVGALAATPPATPNDTNWNYQWGPRNIGVPNAWWQGTGQGVVIGIADTGQTDHPDLNAKTVPGYDFLSDTYHSRDGNGRDANPQDQGDWSPGRPSWWHGSHVAGIAAAQTNNRAGIAGVAPDAKIQHARVLGADGRGYVSDIADGVMWSAGIPVPGVPRNANPAKVVNLSEAWDSGTCPAVMQNAINRMHAINVPLVVAAGNAAKSANLASPANCGGAIVVGATSYRNQLTGYTNWGPMLDVVAPGGDASSPIWSTVNTGTYSIGRPAYGDLSGTSMAAPHVAGVIAIMKERNPDLGVEAIRNTLRSTGSNVSGYRKVNGAAAARAVARAKPTVHGAIATYYNAHGGAAAMGAPTTWELSTGVGGVVQTFTKNGRATSIYWSHETGAHRVETWKGIGTRYSRLGGPAAFGLPAKDELPTSTAGAYQNFVRPGTTQTTKIIWSAATGAQPVVETSAIGKQWARDGHEAGSGYPTSPEVKTAAGAYQRFRTVKTGEITQYTWTRSTGKVVRAALR